MFGLGLRLHKKHKSAACYDCSKIVVINKWGHIGLRKVMTRFPSVAKKAPPELICAVFYYQGDFPYLSRDQSWNMPMHLLGKAG